MLALVGEVIAVATGEKLASTVKLGDPSAAVGSIAINGTSEPGTLAAEVAIGPVQGNVLLYVLPLVIALRFGAVRQNHLVLSCNTYSDVTNRLPIA